MAVTLKIHYTKHGKTDIRRVVLGEEDNFSTSTILEQLNKLWPDTKDIEPIDLKITWKDNEGDDVTLSRDEELQECLKNSSDGVIRLYINEKRPGRQNRAGHSKDGEGGMPSRMRMWRMMAGRGRGGRSRNFMGRPPWFLSSDEEESDHERKGEKQKSSSSNEVPAPDVQEKEKEKEAEAGISEKTKEKEKGKDKHKSCDGRPGRESWSDSFLWWLPGWSSTEEDSDNQEKGNEDGEGGPCAYGPRFKPGFKTFLGMMGMPGGFGMRGRGRGRKGPHCFGPHDMMGHGPHGMMGHGPHGMIGHGPHGMMGHDPHDMMGHGPHGMMGHGPHGMMGHGPHGMMGHGPHGMMGHGPHGMMGHDPHDMMGHGPHGMMGHGPHGMMDHGPHGMMGHDPHDMMGHGPHGMMGHGPFGGKGRFGHYGRRGPAMFGMNGPSDMGCHSSSDDSDCSPDRKMKCRRMMRQAMKHAMTNKGHGPHGMMGHGPYGMMGKGPFGRWRRFGHHGRRGPAMFGMNGPRHMGYNSASDDSDSECSPDQTKACRRMMHMRHAMMNGRKGHKSKMARFCSKKGTIHGCPPWSQRHEAPWDFSRQRFIRRMMARKMRANRMRRFTQAMAAMADDQTKTGFSTDEENFGSRFGNQFCRQKWGRPGRREMFREMFSHCDTSGSDSDTNDVDHGMGIPPRHVRRMMFRLSRRGRHCQPQDTDDVMEKSDDCDTHC